MNNVSVYQNGIYTHNINKSFTRVTSNTIDYIPLETEYTSYEIWYIETNFTLCFNYSHYALQPVDIWKDCNVAISTNTCNFSIYDL